MTTATDLAALNAALTDAASAAATAEKQVAAGTPSEWASISAMFAIANAQKAAAALGLDINPPPPATLVVGTISTQVGTVGTSFFLTVPVSGGTKPYSFLTHTMPAGLTLNATSGVISGTPTTAGAEEFIFSVMDASSPAQEVTPTVNINIAAAAPPPPPPTGKPLWGEYHAGSHYAFTPKIMLDYAYNSASTYPQSAAQGYTNSGYRLMLKVGALTQSQATAIAQALVAGGQANAIIPIMWENNQGVNGWETPWNELAFTAAQFITLFNNICGWMRAVNGAKFTFAWCPNGNQVGNQAPGRNQLDTFPGTGVNGDIVIAPDGYDNPGDTGSGAQTSAVAQFAPFEQLAAQKGAKFAGLCECGNNGSDDPTYWNDLLAHAESAGWQFVVNFQATTQQGGAFNSTTGPNSIAAIKAFYA